MRKIVAFGLAVLFLLPSSVSSPGQSNEMVVTDIGLASGFQNYWDHHYRRGRSNVAQGFDGDGRIDFFIGNPGDESFIFRNEEQGLNGNVHFDPAQFLLVGTVAFTASAFDYDNNGDLDLLCKPAVRVKATLGP